MLFELARRARRRFFVNEMLAQSACAVSAALLAFILLLILGTQILDWYWLVIVPAATFGVGAYRTARRLPHLYRIAQIIDRRLNLSDTLSTALYFADSHGDRVSQDARQSQRAEAERIAASVGIERAIPFTLPRAVYAMSLLGLVASSLFAIRYGIDRRLDLRPPLARIIHEALGGADAQLASAAKKKDPVRKQRPDLKDTLGMAVEDGKGQNPDTLNAPEAMPFDNVGTKDANRQKASSKSDAKGKTPGMEEMPGEQTSAEETEGVEQSQGGSATEGEQSASQGKQKGQQAAESQTGSPGENSSLMSKLRDAMANLLSRMKQQPASSGEQQTAQTQGKQGKESQGGRNSRSGKNQQKGAGEQAQSEDGQPGEEAQNAQAQGQASGQSGEEKASKQPGSGIGRQDGSKDIKLAEQLAAMGKISEIIGKRTANVSGDMTVETQSGDQRLSTPYSRRKVEHSDAGGEINRDEVPVALQSYVQQYFEQVRKQEPPPAAK